MRLEKCSNCRVEHLMPKKGPGQRPGRLLRRILHIIMAEKWGMPRGSQNPVHPRNVWTSAFPWAEVGIIISHLTHPLIRSVTCFFSSRTRTVIFPVGSTTPAAIPSENAATSNTNNDFILTLNIPCHHGEMFIYPRQSR